MSRIAAAGLLAGGVALAAAQAQQPAPVAVKPSPAPARPNQPDAQVVAYLYGNVPVSRSELGEFLIARGGAERLDLLLNKIIIDKECERLKITVTDTEMEAAFKSDVDGLQVDRKSFIEQVLQAKYNKTYYEWMEDVIKPRLQLTKLVMGEVTVSDAEAQVQFEIEYGEKREAQIIMWPGGDNLKAIQDTYAKIRGSAQEFDKAAIAQALPGLAASAGRIKPISRHTHAEDIIIEKRAFSLEPGQVSEIMQTKQGYVVMKLISVIPPDAKVDKAKVMPALRQKALDDKLVAAIPKKFKQLADQARPDVYYTGPAKWRWDTAPATAPSGVVPAGGQAPAAMPAK